MYENILECSMCASINLHRQQLSHSLHRNNWFLTSLVYIVNDIVEKYGQGEISVRKCDTCDYEQEIRSDGVRVSAAGAVSVFCDEDEFFCPNCNSNKSSHEVEDVVSICLLFRMFD
jgi:hypothetical protein